MLTVEKHIQKLLFSQRSYLCEVISRSKNSIFIKLNDLKLICLLQNKTVEPNSVTAIFNENFPVFFIKNNKFKVNNGIFSNFSDSIYLEHKLYKNYNIKNIEFKNINENNIKIIKNWLKKRTCNGMNFIFNNKSSVLSQTLSKKINNLTLLFKLKKYNEFFNKLADIAGYGQGLTPSSDDFICGIIYTIIYLIWSKKIDIKIPFSNIIKIVKKRTVQLSYYYIIIALSGKCSNWQYNIINSIYGNSEISENYLNSIEYGHCSVSDIISGILWFVIYNDHNNILI